MKKWRKKLIKLEKYSGKNIKNILDNFEKYSGKVLKIQKLF